MARAKMINLNHSNSYLLFTSQFSYVELVFSAPSPSICHGHLLSIFLSCFGSCQKVQKSSVHSIASNGSSLFCRYHSEAPISLPLFDNEFISTKAWSLRDVLCWTYKARTIVISCNAIQLLQNGSTFSSRYSNESQQVINFLLVFEHCDEKL